MVLTRELNRISVKVGAINGRGIAILNCIAVHVEHGPQIMSKWSKKEGKKSTNHVEALVRIVVHEPASQSALLQLFFWLPQACSCGKTKGSCGSPQAWRHDPIISRKRQAYCSRRSIKPSSMFASPWSHKTDTACRWKGPQTRQIRTVQRQPHSSTERRRQHPPHVHAHALPAQRSQLG